MHLFTDIRSRLSRICRRQTGGSTGLRCFVLHDDPFILYTGDGADIDPIQAALGDRPAHFILSLWWTGEPRWRVRQLRHRHARRVSRFPSHRFTHFCNTKLECERLTLHGLNAVFAHQNALLDENLFCPIPDVDCRFDAIYDAQLAPFKRHYLATEVERLALISYIEPKERGSRYSRSVPRLLPQAHWLNDPLGDPKSFRLSQEEVAALYNQCRVGLCLSAAEGAMFASIQYLLCGLPVVSTPSIGGRDAFFDADCTRIVEPDSTAVRKAIDEMIALDLNPQAIRQRTIERMQQHRNRFIDAVQDIFDAEGVERDFRAEFPSLFVNKMLRFHRYEDVTALVSNRPGQPVHEQIRGQAA